MLAEIIGAFGCLSFVLAKLSAGGMTMALKLTADQVWAAPNLDPQAPDSARETTRYLCAAAYTDGAFRTAVLARSRETVRARAPEVSVDVAMISEYCRRADHSKAIRDLLLCIASLVLLMFVIAGLVGAADGEITPATVQAVFFCWLAATIITVVEAFRQDGVIRGELTRERFREQTSETAATVGKGNVIVYSGFSPFIGAGLDLGGWSFAIDLDRGKQGVVAQNPRSFGLAELYNRVSYVFDGLHIPNLRSSRKLFVSGRCVRGETEFLHDIYGRPVDCVPDEVVVRYANNSSRQVRHYLCMESVDWDGELAVTLFIRFQKLSSKLFVELSTFLLPPLKPKYYGLDKVHPNRPFQEGVGLVVASMFMAPLLLVLAPFTTLGRVLAKLAQRSERRSQRQQIKNDLLFDYGAKNSVREMATGKEWRVYFQKLDKEMHHKILQQQLLDTLVDFLDEHGVDTSEIKERTTHILNNGVIVSGGSINAQGLAVGEGAQAKVANAARRTRERIGA
jgi:hypothetical protein